MNKVWYCPNCGYEIGSRGRCHSCREKLVESQLAPLAPGEVEDEVGYRLGEWADVDRGRLIEDLNDLEIRHRFEDDELVVAADDEASVDDLVAEISETPAVGEDDDQVGGPGGAAGAFSTGGVFSAAGNLSAAVAPAGIDVDSGPAGESGFADDSGFAGDSGTLAALRLLADAAGRLRADPTDMQADGDVAEASAAVFGTDKIEGIDADTWAAVGRVTRRLLSVLGAEEALEGPIRSDAAVLEKLLRPIVGAPAGAAASSTGSPAGGDESEQTVYELPEWSPEQRAQLGVLLDEAGIAYEWEGGDVVVPAEREQEVEKLFAQVGGPNEDGDEDGGEARYHALEELFAASGRLASDPTDEDRAAAVMMWVHETEGPPPLGFDEVYWLRIMSRAKNLAEAIDGGHDPNQIGEEASALHGLLRTVV